MTSSYQYSAPSTVPVYADTAKSQRVGKLFAGSSCRCVGKLLRSIEEGAVFVGQVKSNWVCRNCGHVAYGENAPQLCPVCAHPRAFFELRADID